MLSQNTWGQTKASQPVEFVGTIHFIALEGGFFGVIDTRGNQYVPLELAQSLQQDGLRVRIKGEVSKQTWGIHNWGQYLRINSIIPTSCLDL